MRARSQVMSDVSVSRSCRLDVRDLTSTPAMCDRFYVVDTRGGALLIFAARPKPALLERVSLRGSPYGIAIDSRRERLWVTLTATNRVAVYDVSARAPRWLDDYPTVRQPNSVAVDHSTGRVFVAGFKDGVLQLLDPTRS